MLNRLYTFRCCDISAFGLSYDISNFELFDLWTFRKMSFRPLKKFNQSHCDLENFRCMSNLHLEISVLCYFDPWDFGFYVILTNLWAFPSFVNSALEFSSYITSTFNLFSVPKPKAQVHYCSKMSQRWPASVVIFSHFRLLLWNHWTQFAETWLLYQDLCFFRLIGKRRWRPGFLLTETFSNSSLKPLNGIWRNLTGSKNSMSSTKCVFLSWSEKQYGRPASDWLTYFRLILWNSWREFDETWQETSSSSFPN